MKEQNGAAMSLGRTSTFLDIYFERDLAAGTLTEEQAQEIIDDFVIKLRIVRFLRTPEYDDLFAGDPTWVTESIGGMGDDGRSLVTKTSFRFLQTLYNLGPAPEPNLTIWYSPRLPDGFRRFAAKVAIDTSSMQFESDEIMRRAWGDDGAIACCVSPMLVGKQMQFFGARANLAKCLLYAINGGRDEISGEQVGPAFGAGRGRVPRLRRRARQVREDDGLARGRVRQRHEHHPLHARQVRLRADRDGAARLRAAANDGVRHRRACRSSPTACRRCKYAKVRVVRDETGLITDYQTEGDVPDVRQQRQPRGSARRLAGQHVHEQAAEISDLPRTRVHTQSVLTITSNVVYGKATGNTPDGRRQGEPFAPGANPMHGRDSHGIHASAASVAKIPYRDAADGISLTTSLCPRVSAASTEDRITNLTAMLDAFFGAPAIT